MGEALGFISFSPTYLAAHHYAVVAGRTENVKLLLTADCHAGDKNSSGASALELAQQQRFEEIEVLLKAAGGKLMHAIRQTKNISAIRLLVPLLLVLSCKAQANPTNFDVDLSDPQLRGKICRPDQFCTLTRRTEVGRDSQGHRVFLIVNDETPQGDPSARYSGCWRTEWWRVTFDGKTVRKTDLIVTERENENGPFSGSGRGDSPCWYGTGGGIEEVTLQKSILIYSIEGGSGSRWNETKEWQFVPELMLLNSRSSQWSVMSGNSFGHSTTHDYQTDTIRDQQTYTLCVTEPNGFLAGSTAVSDQIPAIGSTRNPQFDWRRSDFPAKLRVRADGQREQSTAGFMITKTTARRHIDGSVASISVAAVDHDKLLIEVDDPNVITGGKSWLEDSHIELWLWPGWVNTSNICLIPTWSKEIMKRVAAEDLRAAEQANQESPGAGPIKPGPLYQWGIGIADGRIYAGYGSPVPGTLVFERAQVDIRRTRFLIRLPTQGPVTVLYSTRSAENKQHLFGTSQLRFGDPTSLGSIVFDHGIVNRQQAEQAAASAAIRPLLYEFVHAVERGDLEAIRQGLAREPGLANADVWEGFTALMVAASNGQIEAVKLLLAGKADVNATTKDGLHVLHVAAGADAPGKFVSTSKKSMSPLVFTTRIQSPLDKRLAMAKLLADAGADIDATDGDGLLVLHHSLATDDPNPELVKYLLARTKQPERTSRYGVTAVMLAAGNADTTILKAVLDRTPGTLRAINESGSTALHYAAAAGRAENVKLLLARGADPSITNKNGETPLRQAQLQGFQEIVAALKAAGAK